ncbi:hypothetical protein DB345_02525 [Spartobacteria bacterium LR76]|nr:hypothetical protein DB345_02525 [Spartobacteria bacterium LR76]
MLISWGVALAEMGVLGETVLRGKACFWRLALEAEAGEALVEAAVVVDVRLSTKAAGMGVAFWAGRVFIWGCLRRGGYGGFFLR